MLLVRRATGEGEAIKSRSKISSCRGIRANGKGYLKPDTIQQIRDSRNFKETPVCTVWLFARSFVDIEDLEQKDFYNLGYSSKGEYLAEDFNQRNPSTERVKYSFYVVGHLIQDLQGFGLTPQIIGGLYCDH